MKPLSWKWNAGDIIEVKQHYANYVLFPQWIAVLYDKQTKNQHEAHKRKIDLYNKDLQKSIEKFSADLEANGVTFSKNATENGTLYDSITAKTISQYAEESHNVVIGSEHFTVDPKIEAIWTFIAQFDYNDSTISFEIRVEKS